MARNKQNGLVLEGAELVRDLQQQYGDPDVVLHELLENVVNTLPGAQYAGISIASRDGKVRTAAAVGDYPAVLDGIQQRNCGGPCLSAAWENHVMRIHDVATEQRWPDYCSDAVEETPIRSILSFQLFGDRRTIGALNFFAEQPNAFDDDAVELGLILATHVALAWNMVRRDEQFRSALASRDIIGQAKGMLMERFKIDAVQAFELLKRLSQGSNTPLVAVAKQLVEAEQHGG